MRNRGGTQGYGYLADPVGHTATPAKRLLGSTITPKACTLHDSVVGILDQGMTSSCVGHATVGAVETFFNKLGTPISHRSPVGMYTLARCVDRDGLLTKLQDEGSMPNQAMRALTEWGVPAFGSMPADTTWGQQPDYTKVNAEPGLTCLESADKVELTGVYSVGSDNRIELIKQAVVLGYPICFAVEVDTAFEDWNGVDLLGPPNPSDILGGHYLYAVGYDTLLNGSTVVEFVNSWGMGWGRHGFGLANEDFVAQFMDVYVMNLRKVSQ